MCGRLALYSPPERLARYLEAGLAESIDPDGVPRWNVAPSTAIFGVRTRAPEPGADPVRVLAPFKWGLIPRWAKDESIGNRLANARAESVATTGAFRDAYARRRCLIVADGFYEWAGVDGPSTPGQRSRQPRQPWYLTRVDGHPLTLAGLWERWKDPALGDDAPLLYSATIITTDAGADIEHIHTRMPVIVEVADWDRWLLDDPEAVGGLLVPSAGGTLQSHPVDPRMGRPTFDQPEAIARFDAPVQQRLM